MSTTPPTPSAAAVRLAEQLLPTPFGPPEHLERIAENRKRAVATYAALIDVEIRPLLEALEESLMRIDNVWNNTLVTGEARRHIVSRELDALRAALRRATERAGT